LFATIDVLSSLHLQGGVFMEQGLVVDLGTEQVRFTPDGRVSVLDAIRMVTGSKCPGLLWENLSSKHPQALKHCEEYRFPGEDSISVVDSKGWEMILTLLAKHWSDRNLL
jgi:hypothetical protein